MGEATQSKFEALGELQEANKLRFANLTANGMNIPDTYIIAQRVETLIDVLLGELTPNNHNRVRFERAWQEKLQEVVEAGEQKLASDTLSGKRPPTQSKSGLIIPGTGG